MDKTQKEKIREKWKIQYPDCTTGGVKCIDCSDKDDIETFWLNELDLAIKETEERLVMEIEGLYIYGGDTKADSGECGEYNRALDDIKKYIYENS